MPLLTERVTGWPVLWRWKNTARMTRLDKGVTPKAMPGEMSMDDEGRSSCDSRLYSKRSEER